MLRREIMRHSVDLHAQPCLVAVEIKYIRPGRMLSAKVEACLSAPERPLQQAFGFRHPAAKPARALKGLLAPADFHLTPPSALRAATSPKGGGAMIRPIQSATSIGQEASGASPCTIGFHLLN
ncbi:hypothetical protein GCM10022280_13080 [Sphingomonas swuensis]|uniref:Thioesterase domain-containing protein n=1 Tax=Sphingomonas swuensis TaxID=977800 RepID=A0ABP7SRW3_9SPHN